ncbi:hypothetical protein Scep_008308 [Stephania cephalantha]|uniref:non-specific serine/threonine protein kinase n=1 Tax=Stephania cephalantha TaxID=152367 RepID=A0AAP0KBE3_9MAGN
MGSCPGICEIIESKDELDSFQHSNGSIQPCFASIADEKVGKLPMLKTGRNCSVQDDLNQIFEAIDRRASVRSLGLSQKSDAESKSKNASKKPVRIGVSQASGIGISESVTLKQALRGLCISHASEMAAMKRLSKSVGSPGFSEAGAAKRLYRAVVVEASEPGLPLDDGKGSMVEISLVPESSTSDSCQTMTETLQVARSNSSTPSVHSSPRLAVATTTKATKDKGQLKGEIVIELSEAEGRKQIPKSVQKGNLKSATSLSNSNTIKSVLEQEETGSTFSDDGSKASKLKSVQKCDPSLTPSFRDSNTVSKPSQSASNSPRAVKPIVTSATIKKLAAVRREPRDEIIPQPMEAGTKTSTVVMVQKEKVRSAMGLSISSTIKKVLEVDDPDPVLAEVGCKKSFIEPSLKGDHHSLPSFFSSNISIKVSKSASNSPRTVKPAIRPKGFRKKTQTTCDDVSNGDELPGTNSMSCRTPSYVQQKLKKEPASPSSSNTSSSYEVNSSSTGQGASNLHSSSNGFNNRVQGVKANAKSNLREKGDFSQSSSSIGDYSSSTSISDESNLSGSSCGGSRPHMSKDLRWDAVRFVEMRTGSLELRNFKLLKRLGCGDIGTVYLAELIGTDCLFALKVMDNEFLASRKKMPRARTEREILQMLDHPFLPTLYSHFTTDKFSCLVMEFCPGGDLHVLRQKQPNRCFSEEAARFYVAEVLLALEYLHMLGVVYRDLKPENILVREDGHIMLSDFDLSLRCTVSPTLLKSSSSIVEPAKKLTGPCAESSCIDPFCLQPSWAQASCFSPRLVSTPAKARKPKPKSELAAQVTPLPQLVAEPTSARSNSFVGTHEYLAPEIIKGDGHGSAVDWWTFGVFLYELLYGKTPFKGSGNEETLANVVTQCLKFPDDRIVSFQARDLIRGLLVKEPDNRMGSVRGAAEIKQHQFFEGLNWALIRCAIPPELPKSFEAAVIAAAPKKNTAKTLEFKANGKHVEFELF